MKQNWSCCANPKGFTFSLCTKRKGSICLLLKWSDTVFLAYFVKWSFWLCSICLFVKYAYTAFWLRPKQSQKAVSTCKVIRYCLLSLHVIIAVVTAWGGPGHTWIWWREWRGMKINDQRSGGQDSAGKDRIIWSPAYNGSSAGRRGEVNAGTAPGDVGPMLCQRWGSVLRVHSGRVSEKRL